MTLLLGVFMLGLTACSSGHKPALTRAELLSRPVFQSSTAGATLILNDSATSAVSSADPSPANHHFQMMSTSPTGGGDPCAEAFDPLLSQAQQGIADLNSSVAGSNSALSAATGGNPAAMAALMAAAAQMMQNQNSGSTPAATAAASPVPSTADQTPAPPKVNTPNGSGGFNASVEDPKNGSAGFDSGTQDPNRPAGGASLIGRTQDPRSNGGGGSAGSGGGTTPGGSAGFVGGVGDPRSTPGAVNDHAGFRTASVEASATSEGFGGYTNASGATAGSSDGMHGQFSRAIAARRAPASLTSDLPILRLNGFQDIATKYSPNIFNLLSKSYGGYCRVKNISSN